jgi:hypothetical protein
VIKWHILCETYCEYRNNRLSIVPTNKSTFIYAPLLCCALQTWRLLLESLSPNRDRLQKDKCFVAHRNPVIMWNHCQNNFERLPAFRRLLHPPDKIIVELPTSGENPAQDYLFYVYSNCGNCSRFNDGSILQTRNVENNPLNSAEESFEISY